MAISRSQLDRRAGECRACGAQLVSFRLQLTSSTRNRDHAVTRLRPMRSTTRGRQARSRVLYGVSKAATSRSIPRWAPPRVVCIGLHRACGTEQATRRSLVAGAFSVLRLPAGLATGPHKHVHSCDRDDESHADNGCRAALTFRL